MIRFSTWFWIAALAIESWYFVNFWVP